MNEVAQPTTRFLTRPPTLAKTLVVPVALCALTLAAVMPTILSAPHSTRSVALPMFLAGAGITLGVGLHDLARGWDVRFALVLIAAGILWSLASLAASREPALYSVGRVSEWLVGLATLFLLLSYPSGRLTGTARRILFGAAVLNTVLLFLPTALIAQQFPNPSPWSACTAGCPHNAFAIGNSTPAIVPNVLVPGRELLTVMLFVVVAGLAVQRSRSSGPLLRRMCIPIAVIAVALAVVLAVYFRARANGASASGLDLLRWIYVVSLPAIALATVAGRLYRRLFAFKAVDRIARQLGAHATPAQVGRVLADALEDPTLRILLSFPSNAGQWVDESGAAVRTPQGRSEQVITEIADGRWRLAVIHDRALAEDPALVETAGLYALAALENDRLGDDLRLSLTELAQARALGINAERRGRRKIERDIHDGAQQRLVALRVKLALTAEDIASHDVASADALRALADDVDATIDEVRSFASGVYPALLAETGLAGALRTLARGTALPTTFSAERLGRYSREIETTVYFSCSEALQNASKHALGATSVAIRVWDDGDLNFEVSDDGPGFDLAGNPYGSGLSGLRDRLVAVGGSVRIRSAPGQGTSVGGTIPTTGAGRERLPAVF